jgi:transposase
MDVQIGIPRRLSYLPAVMDVLRRCGIFSIIDQAIQDDPRSKVTTSECVAVILCGVFLGHHDLWRLADRLAPFDMATVLQDADVDLSLFTEERLAKALDNLHAADLDKLITPLAIHTIEQFRISTAFFHFDTTSLTLFGAYESEEFGSMSESIVPTPPMITFGYSKDHRPDLKQILFGTLVSCDGGVPVYGKALDGNRSDNESAAEFFMRVRKLVKNPKDVCCVADSKGWCARVLHVIQNDRLRLLSRLPRNHTLHSVIMAKPWNRPQRVQRLKANGKRSEDYYELIGYDAEEVLSYKDARTTPATDTVVEVSSRAVRVFSSALMRQKLGTLERTTKREAAKATKMMKEWGALAYACKEDAQRAAERDQRSTDFVTLDISTTVRSVAGPFKRGRGRPSIRREAELPSSHYRIDFDALATPKRVAIGVENWTSGCR